MSEYSYARPPWDTAAGRERLGEVLVGTGAVTSAQVDAALAEQQQEQLGRRRRLGRILIDVGAISETQLAHALAQVHRLPVVDPDRVPYDADVARLIPQHVAARYCLMPLGWNGASLRVMVSDPVDIVALDDVRALTGATGLEVAVAPESAVLAQIRHVWMLHETQTAAERFALDVADPTAPPGADTARDAATAMIDRLLQHAVRIDATDVHLDPEPGGTHVRMRVDGVLREVIHLTPEGHPHLVDRVRTLSGMAVTDQRVPQDGRVRMQVGDRTLDVRASVLPALYGQAVAMRLLPLEPEFTSLESLGMTPADAHVVRTAIERRRGMILVAGPNGSGRTSTMYAALAARPSPPGKVVAVQDPAAIEVAGITQVPVDPNAGVTYAEALLGALRHGPDVLLVEEIRDPDSAGPAVAAALSGRLVLASVHAPDAAAALARLVGLGVPAAEVSSAVTVVVAQRLVRRPCASCAVADEGTTGVVVAAGCSRCGWTGYHGRSAIFEVVAMTPELRDLLESGADVDHVRAWLSDRGHGGLTRSAASAVMEGRTTFDEATTALAGLVPSP